MNPLLRLCEGASPRGAPATFCTASAGSRDLKSATDTSVYSSAAIAAVTSTNGQPIAWFEAALPGGAQAVSRVSVKGWYGSTAPLSVVLLLQGGGRVQVVTVTAAENYNWVHTLGSWQVRGGRMMRQRTQCWGLQHGGCATEVEARLLKTERQPIEVAWAVDRIGPVRR